MDCDADESATPSVKMGGNLHTILYVCLVQILPLIFQKKKKNLDLLIYTVTKFFY